MSTSINVKTTLKVESNFVNVLNDGTNVTDALSASILSAAALSNGAGSGKVQVQWHDRRTLATTTSEDIDLAGVLSSAFGVVTFTKIKALIIKVNTVTTGYRLEVGGAAANAFASMFGDVSDTVKVQADGVLLLYAPVDGYTVTAGTADILKISNPSGGSVSYDIIVIGEGSVA
ncbi:MAG: hypothetical protein ABFD54_05705 [Armatimonadota bacterium]|nr:hypothetical protein [bacterium]